MKLQGPLCWRSWGDTLHGLPFCCRFCCSCSCRRYRTSCTWGQCYRRYGIGRTLCCPHAQHGVVGAAVAAATESRKVTLDISVGNHQSHETCPNMAGKHAWLQRCIPGISEVTLPVSATMATAAPATPELTTTGSTSTNTAYK